MPDTPASGSENADLNIVTGAFSYTGKYIARRLLASGKRVRTLTGHPHRPDPFNGQVSAAPLDFDDPDGLVRDLKGASVLYNTYWVRFNRGEATFARAVENTNKLLEAAKQAGIRKVVHVSITNASENSTLPYFHGKWLVESAVRGSGLSYAILRPTVVFGDEDILINNIAWMLRRFPLFAVPGSGDYRLQPVFVDDVAEMALRAAEQHENLIADAVGPETYRFDELVRLIAEAVRSKARLIYVNPRRALFFSSLVGAIVRDVVLTPAEIEGLMSNLLLSPYAPARETSLRAWLHQNADRVGCRYASEISRHFH
jgi:uncharacterized protein YbjT (DUF2867 family)